MGWVHYCPMTCRCVWCRPASPVSAWEWELGAGREKCIAWPRCGSAWPGQPPGRSALQAVTGCHSLYTLQLSCVRRAFAKNPFVMKHILHTLTLTLWFQWILAWKYWNCDIIVKCFLAKITGTEMTERPCLYLWWDSSGSVSTLLTSWKSQFTIYNLHYLGSVYICQWQCVPRVSSINIWARESFSMQKLYKSKKF